MLTVFKWCAVMGYMTIFSAFSSHSDSFNELSVLINDRLSYMKDIAAFKAEKHLATEDPEQEKFVFEQASGRAKTVGLDETSVRFFISAQINAAKAIQYRYRADWLSAPEIAWQPRNLAILRPQIARLNDEILTKLHALLICGVVIDDRLYSQFRTIVDPPHLTDQDKKQLFMALEAVKLSASDPLPDRQKIPVQRCFPAVGSGLPVVFPAHHGGQ